jgi:thiamine pyrophosphate-dependent acetolactate synthase large subunit-like protein
MARMTGKKALLEMLRAEGVEYIFGNPGTSEGAIMDALEDYPDIHYVLATQEGAAMGAADAYARATGKPSFVNLHIETGLANGISLLHNAAAGGTPLVLTAGNKDMRKLIEGRTPLADMVKTFTKWSAELTHPEQIPAAIRRAFNEARTPPTGPTFIAFSANALDGEADMEIVPNSKGYFRMGPDADAIKEAAGILANAKNPIMLVGDRVAQSGAAEEAVRVAEMLGAPVYSTLYSEMNFPSRHPLYKGPLLWGFPSGKEALADADAVIAVGNTFSGYFFFPDEGNSSFSPGTRVVHMDASPVEVGKSEPTDVGIIADPKIGLAQLAVALEGAMSGSAQEAAKGRSETVAGETAAARVAWEARIKERWDMSPMSQERMMAEVAAVIPDDTVIVDDSVTTRAAVNGAIEFNRPGQVFGERGGAIGWGIGGGMGAKLANPDKPVIAILGDGSAMMTVQGYYTAAIENIPIVYIICNNESYRVLKVNMDVYKSLVVGQNPPQSKYMAMDFPQRLDHAAMARAMGVYGVRIEDPAQIGPELKKAFASGKPAVLDIVIDGAL